MAGKPINKILAEALAFYMEGRFSALSLAKKSGVAANTIGNMLNPDRRTAGKSGKEPSAKLTEVQMLADALEVPFVDLVTDMTPDQRLEGLTRRAAEVFISTRKLPAWAPRPADDGDAPAAPVTAESRALLEHVHGKLPIGEPRPSTRRTAETVRAGESEAHARGRKA